VKGTGFSPYIKTSNINASFTGCGKTHPERQEASGHDFSRADRVCKIDGALAPEELPHAKCDLIRDFLSEGYGL